MTPTFPLFASFVFEFQPSQHWSNFYATTRGPVLRRPQVAHDSSRASSMGFASAMSSLFEEESSGGIGYDQGEGLSRKNVISLCSHHCSHQSILTFPTVPTITPPLSQHPRSHVEIDERAEIFVQCIKSCIDQSWQLCSPTSVALE